MKNILLFATLIQTLSYGFAQVVEPRQTTSVTKLPIVSTQGNALWANGSRFYIRGVAYQPGGAADAADPLADIPSLRRDIKHFKQLGINTIRVYTVDNSIPHNEGMRMLDEAGIYLALDANTPDFSLNRADPHLSYNDRYLQSVFATIDNFAGYSNLLMFFSGNEVIDDKTNTNTAPYIKAVTRDMKTYISNRGYRNIPVAYAAADVSENIEDQLHYMDCGAELSRTDVFAINDYSWCDPSSFQKSGWNEKVQRYSNYGAPLFLAEFGCNANTRRWGEISSLYNSDEMTPVYSGGLAYEYTVEQNGYGLVDLKGGKIVPNADFYRLREAFAATPNPTGDGGARRTTVPSTCPSRSKTWDVRDLQIPAPPRGIAKYMSDGAGKGPGLGDDVETSHFGGNSYSNRWVSMNYNQLGSGAGNGGDNNSGGGGGSEGGMGSIASHYDVRLTWATTTMVSALIVSFLV